jgi:hypothetical protein
VECAELVEATIASQGKIADIKETVVEDMPDAKRQARTFMPTEGTKEVILDPSSSDGKVVRVGTSLSPK